MLVFYTLVGVDKFIGSDLEARLKAKGIETVIVMGTSAQGAVVGTSKGAVKGGYTAVVPVVLSKSVTLTRGDMIKFGD